MHRVLTFIVLAPLLAHPLLAEDTPLEELLVTGERNLREFELADTVDIEPDSAELLRKTPGGNINRNGPLTGIAQLRGMFGYRISTHINGIVLSPGGPNWMDPPLSYAPAAQLESLEVHRGIAPVSAGQETIGGAINATTWSGDFTDGDFAVNGRIRAGGRSVDEGTLLSGMVTLANSNHRLKLSAFTESGSHANFAGGKILPTEYERQRYDVGYGFKAGAHTIQLDYGRNQTGDAGSPALPMDIQYIDSDLSSFRYEFEGENYRLEGRLYYADIDHGMTNYELRRPPIAGSMYRRNIAVGKNTGFSFQSEFGSWRVGVDGLDEKHDSDIDNPNNPMFFVVNFNNAIRRGLGIFAERELTFTDEWVADLGIRYNNIAMDASEVNGTPAMMSMMGMSPGRTLRDDFNNTNRSKTDNNFDWVAKLYYAPNELLGFYAGISRKTRSPSYQERLPVAAPASHCRTR